MSDTQPFLSPRLVGERFAGHTIPLEALKDFSALEEMIVNVAKWRYLQDHPGRKRSPRGFTKGVSLSLIAIDEGSAIAQIVLSVDPRSSFSTEKQRYFEQARDCIIDAIHAADQGSSITRHLPEALLRYFDRIGRGLRDSEYIEFRSEDMAQPARLSKITRRRLIFASSKVQELAEEVALRGTIPEADQRKMVFKLEIIGGTQVPAPITNQHLDIVLEAFNGFQNGQRVLLQGIGRFKRTERLQGIKTVEHLSLLEANDISARIDELRMLKDGWLDGKGIAPSTPTLDWLAQRFETKYPELLPLPCLYPTFEGGVQVEWSIATWETTLGINPNDYSGEWHTLDMETGGETIQKLNLGADQDWRWLVGQIQQQTGG